MKDRAGSAQASPDVLRRQLDALNRRLEEAEAFKGNFLSNIRNEINNPLSAILGLSEQILAGDLTAAETSNHARMIHQEAFSLDYQLNNICMAAEVEAGEARPFYARIDVDAIFTDVQQSLEHLRREKGIELDLVRSDLGQVVSDARMLHLVLINLLANAYTFCSDRSRVAVAISCSDDTLAVSIGNRGPELNKDQIRQAFDRFRQLESGPCKSHPGHGIGLSLVKALTELLGGEIAVTSPAPNLWRVVVTLPCQGQPEAGQASEGNLVMFDNAELF